MTTIVTRAGKGSPLTNNEMDQNLTNLNNDKIETSAIGVSVQAYDADTAKLDVVQTWTATQTFGTVNTTAVTGDGSGLTNLTTPVKAVQIQLGTPVASTSGTVVDFTGIPSWAKRVTIMLAGVSTNSTSNLLVQLGDSGGIENSGYIGAVANTNGASTGSETWGVGATIARAVAAASTYSGVVDVCLVDSSTNTWVIKANISTNGTVANFCAGHKSLSAALDRVRVTSVTPDTFDAGTINITWE